MSWKFHNPNFNFKCLWQIHPCFGQRDRQTDGRAIAYSASDRPKHYAVVVARWTETSTPLCCVFGTLLSNKFTALSATRRGHDGFCKEKNNIFGRLLVQTNSKQQFVELYIEMTNCRYIFASVYYKVKYFHYLPPLSTALTDASAVSDSWLSCCFKL